jgi:hypothetical protein
LVNEQNKITWKNDARIVSNINNTWAKVEKYYYRMLRRTGRLNGIPEQSNRCRPFERPNNSQSSQLLKVYLLYQNLQGPIIHLSYGSKNTEEQALDNGLRDEYIQNYKTTRE